MAKHTALEAGVYEVPLSPIPTVDERDEIIPAKFELRQNYPNPFNPVTSIQYSVAGDQLVSLKVYDLLGREVATLVNERQPAGHYRVTFDARNLGSGIYFYKLSVGEFIQTRKMVLMR